MSRPVSRAVRHGTILGAMLCIGSAAPSYGASAIPNFAPNPNVGWVAVAPQFIAPPSGPGPVMDDPQHGRVSNDDFRANGRQPTFPVGDVNSPILQPWAREQIRKHNELILSGKPAFSRQASCWPIGVPGFLLYPVQPVYFVQTPKQVLITWQADHQVRHVYLTGKHSARITPTDYGESIGHYEGDTLVVDTIGIHTRTFVDNYQTPHTDKLHVVERFHMIDGGKTLEVNVHVEDPGAFTMPWNAIQRYTRVEPGIAENKDPLNPISSSGDAGPMLEVACAENNDVRFFGDGALPIPQADKPDF